MSSVVVPITPAIRDKCRDVLNHIVRNDSLTRAIEDAIWQWSRGIAPTTAPTSSSVNAAQLMPPPLPPSRVTKPTSSSSTVGGKRKELTTDVPTPKPSKRRKKTALGDMVEYGYNNAHDATSTASATSVAVPVNANISYEGKFKQLAHNLHLNKEHLLTRYTPDMLVWLDDSTLAKGTPYENLRQETTLRAKRLNDILNSTESVASLPIVKVAASTTFLRCRRCKSTRIQFNQKQTRSGDEGMTSFCTCQDCHTTWKMS
jgi:transcription elongation factor S-II